MIRDAQDHDLTGATAEAARSIDAGVRAYTLAYGEPMAQFEAARAAAPTCAMAEMSKAWLHAMSNDSTGVATARASIEGARTDFHRSAIDEATMPTIDVCS